MLEPSRARSRFPHPVSRRKLRARKVHAGKTRRQLSLADVAKPPTIPPTVPRPTMVQVTRPLRRKRVTEAGKPVQVTRTTARVARGVLRFLAFYVMASSLIVAGIALHEYSHYAAHEGLGMPTVAYSDGVEAAHTELLQLERSRGHGGDIILRQPAETTIVFYPNTFVQAAGLGLLPAQVYQDDGVLASTFFRLEGNHVEEMRARDGQMPALVVAAPLLLAVGVFLLALAWALLRPNLFNKALLLAYAVQIGDAGHHASAIGMQPDVFYGLSSLLIVAAAVLVGLRSLKVRGTGTGKASRSHPQPGKPSGTPSMPWVPSQHIPGLSVHPFTDNSTTRRPAQALRTPVNWT